MAKYKQIMQVSLCGKIERTTFNDVTVNGGDVMSEEVKANETV